MKLQKPLVSVILPVYNSEGFIKASVESLLNQSHKEIEIIAIDDFSKDNSYRILNKYRKQDKRLRVFKNKKRYGLAICLNRAVKRAKGDFITFMDAKDRSKIDRIKKQVSYLLNHPKIAALGTQVSYFDEKNKRIGHSSFPTDGSIIYQNLLSTGSIQLETVMINKTLLPKDLLQFKANAYPFTYSEVFLKIFQYGELANLMETLYYRRKENEKKERLIFSSQYLVPFVKLFVKSIAQSDYYPSMRSLLQPLAK